MWGDKICYWPLNFRNIMDLTLSLSKGEDTSHLVLKRIMTDNTWNAAHGEGRRSSIWSNPGPSWRRCRLHGCYYAEHWGFPDVFEDKVAREMGGFLCRYDPMKDLVLWTGYPNRYSARSHWTGAIWSCWAVGRICVGLFSKKV